MTKQQYDRAYLQGVTARQTGKKADANPYRDKPALRALGEGWLSGWQAEDMKIRGQR